jgi:hypothetical protein
MPDVRRKVEEDRGLLKKIQLIIPGYRGYRIREDLRDSDKIMRLELAKRLALQRDQLEESRADLLAAMPMAKEVTSLGGVINQYKKVEGLVKYSESGYSGFVTDVRFDIDELNRIYDYDYSVLENVQFIDEAIGVLKGALDEEDEVKIKQSIKDVKKRLTGLEDKWKKRIAIIQGTEL